MSPWCSELLIRQDDLHPQRGRTHDYPRPRCTDRLGGGAGHAGLPDTNSRGFEGWWEGVKPTFPPEFIEWVEEQRAKAA